MRQIPAWEAYDGMAASGAYGALLDPQGELALTPDGRREAAFFREALAGRDLVLDLGCGPGFTLVVLAGAGMRVFGVDASPTMLSLARGNLAALGIGSAGLARALAEHLPFADATFDGVAECGALGSVSDPAPVIRELARVARPGAVVASLEQDFRRRLAPGCPREERRLQGCPEGVALRVVRYLEHPCRIRDERYLLDPANDFCRRAVAGREWGGEWRAPTEVRREDLPAGAIRDATCEEEAQFDPESLRECFERGGLALVSQQVADSYGVPHIFSLFRRAEQPERTSP